MLGVSSSFDLRASPLSLSIILPYQSNYTKCSGLVSTRIPVKIVSQTIFTGVSPTLRHMKSEARLRFSYGYLVSSYLRVTLAPASSSFAFNASSQITKSFVPSIHKSLSVRDPASDNSLPDCYLPALKLLKSTVNMKKHRQMPALFHCGGEIT